MRFTPKLEGSRPRSIHFIALGGLGLWFFLGFPFDHQNESYRWAPQLEGMNLVDALTEPVRPVANPRPLGTALAWMTFTLGGGSVWLQQLLNFALAVAAWIILLVSTGVPRTLALVLLLCGGVFFTGYVYLFHLHGVFYSPALVYLALLLGSTGSSGVSRAWPLFLLMILGAIASLFHPFSLAFLVAFLVGAMGEGRLAGRGRKRVWIWVAMMSVGALIAFQLGGRFVRSDSGLSGLMTSFRTVEVNPIVSIVAALLAVWVATGMVTRRWPRMCVAGVVSLGCAMAVRSDFPVAALWIAACLVRVVQLRRWTLACLLAASTLFPLATGTGSPTYLVFGLFCAAAATAEAGPRVEGRLSILDRREFLAVLPLVAVLVVLVRAGIEIPVFDRLAGPLLAERERTEQLADIVDWFAREATAEACLVLAGEAADPSKSDTALNRAKRPPTDQMALDDFLRGQKGQGTEGCRSLTVFFDANPEIASGAIFESRRPHAGRAVVVPESER